MAIDLTGGLPVEREYVFAERPGPDVRDAVNIWLEEESGAFAMRIGVEALAELWEAHDIWLDIAFPDGRVISARERGTTLSPFGACGQPTIPGAGPLQFECVEPFKHWTSKFAKHPVKELTAKPLIVDVYPPNPKLRFEQLCGAEGFLEIDGVRSVFKGQALRIKRQGDRKFEGFWGHCWQSALFRSGKAFGVNVFPPRADGKPSLNEGYIFDGNGALKPARALQVPWMKKFYFHGEDVPLVLETANGVATIEGTTFINCRSLGASVLPATFPVVQ